MEAHSVFEAVKHYIFQGVLGTRIGSLESEKIIIGSLQSEKIVSLKSENWVPTGPYQVPDIFF